MASELRICSRTVPKRSFQIKIFKGRDFSIYFEKMILFYLILLKNADVNADLLWWNRNRNNDLFPGVTVGQGCPNGPNRRSVIGLVRGSDFRISPVITNFVQY